MSIKGVVTLVTWLRFLPRNRANLSSPHPYGPPLHRRGILQAPPLPGPRAMRPQPQTLPLLTEAELVDTLMYLHLPLVDDCLLANQVL
ncbi:hypothetical protein GmHk_16G046549 [Glycine max]|nr:hypothetical protein GmHk_16G046549 [Glycine max]